ncbi:MAG: carboxypeptidase-like regulatory domain-containing protein, partial [Bacteroidota bacterium]
MKLLLTLIISFFVVNSSFSQELNSSISGKLVDADGRPLSYVAVAVEDTDLRAFTNESGAFSFKGLKPQSYTLSFTKEGFRSQSKQIVLMPNKAEYLQIRLEEEFIELDEVVISDKSDTRKVEESSFAVQSIDVESFKNSSLDASQVLNSRSGVRIR